jgi:hypothetical protein
VLFLVFVVLSHLIHQKPSPCPSRYRSPITLCLP